LHSDIEKLATSLKNLLIEKSIKGNPPVKVNDLKLDDIFNLGLSLDRPKRFNVLCAKVHGKMFVGEKHPTNEKPTNVFSKNQPCGYSRLRPFLQACQQSKFPTLAQASTCAFHSTGIISSLSVFSF